VDRWIRAKVIDLRRRLYPERDGYHMIGASVTDQGWLDEVPADRPALIIAEGLLPYLEDTEVHRLLAQLMGRFKPGELIFDGIAAWLVRMLKAFRWGIRDPGQIERQNPRLRCLEQVPFTTHYAWIPVRRYRILYRVMNGIPRLRSMFHEFRFTLGPDSPIGGE
jgi:O-methyltransferase involved in polyketide biosynthesis